MPTLILDFDDTLYNTSLLKQAHFQAVKPFLIKKTRAFWDDCAKQVIANYGYYLYKKNLALTTTPGHYLPALKAYERATARSREFIYPDTPAFLKKSAKKFDLILLSHGQPSFQRKKIKASHCERFFKKIIITTGLKYKEFPKIKSRFQPPYIFIDDKGSEIDPFKKKYPEVICYWIRRPNGKNRNQPCQNFDYKITNLKINL